MPDELPPEYVLGQLEKGRLSLVYLFYGDEEFRLEKVLDRIREGFVPEGSRDFNLQIYYGDNADPADIIDAARSVPFMSSHRLIIVRRTEAFSAATLESFLPYLDNPVESTCLIFVSSRANFTTKFYRRLRALGGAVHFRPLGERQVGPWIKKTAKGLGLDMEDQACVFLQQIVGNRLRDIYVELEKISLCYGAGKVGTEEVKELAIHSRSYTIFELMDEVSFKRQAGALAVLNRFLEAEGKDGALRIVGMLNRQIRLLGQAKSVFERGGQTYDVARKIRLPNSLANKVVKQSKCWTLEELEAAFHLLYKADGLLKSGSRGSLILENLILSLCASHPFQDAVR